METKQPFAFDVTGAVKSQEAVNGLPVKGYSPTQPVAAVVAVNEGKELQEKVLRYIDKTKAEEPFDARLMALGGSYIEIGFGLLAKAIFQPGGHPRIALPGDEE